MENSKSRIRKRRYKLIKNQNLFYKDEKGKNKILSFFSSLFLLLSISLGVLIYGKNDENGKWLKENFGIELSFVNVNSTISKALDMVLDYNIFNFITNEDMTVSNEEMYTYLGDNLYQSIDTGITSIGNGTVILKEKIDNKYMIVVQNDLGVIITYSNLDEVLVNTYDRINNKDVIALSYENIKIEFVKDKKYLNYEEAKEIIFQN